MGLHFSGILERFTSAYRDIAGRYNTVIVEIGQARGSSLALFRRLLHRQSFADPDTNISAMSSSLTLRYASLNCANFAVSSALPWASETAFFCGSYE
jgi:hypothetical protein